MIMSVAQFEKEFKKNKMSVDESYNTITSDTINTKIVIIFGKVEIIKTMSLSYKFVKNNSFVLDEKEHYYDDEHYEIQCDYQDYEDYETTSNIENYYTDKEDCLFRKINEKILYKIEENSFLTMNINIIKDFYNYHLNEIKKEKKVEIKENLKEVHEQFKNTTSF